MYVEIAFFDNFRLKVKANKCSKPAPFLSSGLIAVINSGKIWFGPAFRSLMAFMAKAFEAMA